MMYVQVACMQANRSSCFLLAIAVAARCERQNRSVHTAASAYVAVMSLASMMEEAVMASTAAATACFGDRAVHNATQ